MESEERTHDFQAIDEAATPADGTSETIQASEATPEAEESDTSASEADTAVEAMAELTSKSYLFGRKKI